MSRCALKVSQLLMQYEHFIQANKEATKALIPPKRKSKSKEASNDPRGDQVRKEVQQQFAVYQANPTCVNHDKLKKAKFKLQDAYDKITDTSCENRR